MKNGRRLFQFFIPFAACCLGAFCQAAQKKPCPEPSPAIDAKYVPGQVWSYHSRDNEPDATITILKVESLPKIGVVLHIRLDGIHLRNCSGGPEPDQIEHAPFTRDAIDRSVVRLIRTGNVPPFQEGYENWHEHCGGVYTITVAQMIAVDEQTFNSGTACHA
jgi:hypothetical protein